MMMRRRRCLALVSSLALAVRGASAQQPTPCHFHGEASLTLREAEPAGGSLDLLPHGVAAFYARSQAGHPVRVPLALDAWPLSPSADAELALQFRGLCASQQQAAATVGAPAAVAARWSVEACALDLGRQLVGFGTRVCAYDASGYRDNARRQQRLPRQGQRGILDKDNGGGDGYGGDGDSDLAVYHGSAAQAASVSTSVSATGDAEDASPLPSPRGQQQRRVFNTTDVRLSNVERRHVLRYLTAKRAEAQA
jgi:hypothetical protein